MADFTDKKSADLKGRAQAMLMRGLYYLIPLLPLTASYRLSRWLAVILVRLLPRQRKTVLGNLQVAFGSSLSDAEKAELVKATAGNMITSFFECLYLARLHHTIASRVTLKGKEHLDRALDRGKGVIAVSAHFGNFITLGSFMVGANYPFHIVLRDPSSPSVSRVFRFFRDKAGQQWITTTPPSQCQREILACLRSNRIVCIIADEYKRHGGVPVNFFGHPVPTATGPALLCLRTGAPLITLFVVRQQDDTHVVVIDPPLDYEPTGNRATDIRCLTALFTARIEQYIRRYPAQWWWLNRRWKGISPGDKHYRGRGSSAADPGRES